MGEVWFSAKCVLVSIIRGEPNSFLNIVIVFKSTDFDSAFKKALALGHIKESSYTNNVGDIVSWKLVKIETLDMLNPFNAEGTEVYSEFVNIEKPITLTFSPEASPPTQCGV